MKKEIFITLAVIFGIFILMGATFGLWMLVFPFKYKTEIVASCEETGLSEGLVASIIFVESRFERHAKSSKGAMGLMQLMPSTAKSFYPEEEFDVSVLYEPKENIKIGTTFLKYLFDKYQDEVTVLACYNAGETVVRSWMNEEGKLEKTQIEYKETLNYVEKVQKYKKLYKIYF